MQKSNDDGDLGLTTRFSSVDMGELREQSVRDPLPNRKDKETVEKMALIAALFVGPIGVVAIIVIGIAGWIIGCVQAMVREMSQWIELMTNGRK